MATELETAELVLAAVKPPMQGKGYRFLKFTGGREAIVWGETAPADLETKLLGKPGVYKFKPPKEEGFSPTLVHAVDKATGEVVFDDLPKGRSGGAGSRGGTGRSTGTVEERRSIEAQKALDKAGATLQGAVSVAVALIPFREDLAQADGAVKFVVEACKEFGPAVEAVAGGYARAIRAAAGEGAGSPSRGGGDAGRGREGEKGPALAGSGAASGPPSHAGSDPSGESDATHGGKGAALNAALAHFKGKRALAAAYEAKHGKPFDAETATAEEVRAILPQAQEQGEEAAASGG